MAQRKNLSTATPRVSERDKERMHLLGRMKAESHAEARREHLALSGRDRLERALTMMLAGPYFAGRAPTEDNPGDFYDRAWRLGLYRPRQ